MILVSQQIVLKLLLHGSLCFVNALVDKTAAFLKFVHAFLEPFSYSILEESCAFGKRRLVNN